MPLQPGTECAPAVRATSTSFSSCCNGAYPACHCYCNPGKLCPLNTRACSSHAAVLNGTPQYLQCVTRLHAALHTHVDIVYDDWVCRPVACLCLAGSGRCGTVCVAQEHTHVV